jgi:GT2 family glycosyltransferase
MSSDAPLPVTVVIPTYGRERVLIETLGHLLGQEPAAAEIIVVDQTFCHDDETRLTLEAWTAQRRLQWLRQAIPSIPKAMNAGLLAAASPVVLFLDDDVVPGPGLIESHWRNYSEPAIWSVAGQVLQPGEGPIDSPAGNRGSGIWADLGFPFNSRTRRFVSNCMAGNLSVRRDRSIAVGGFDENFLGAAYRFETDFARRIASHGGKVLFEPAARIRHLRAVEGGTRSAGDPLRSHRPDHSIGDYYFAFVHGTRWEALAYASLRLRRSIATRYHLRHPWWIPSKLLGELRGLIGAMRLATRGPRLLAKEYYAGMEDPH